MRVLHLSWEFPPVLSGGLGRYVESLCRAQAAAGQDVVVVSVLDRSGRSGWTWSPASG